MKKLAVVVLVGALAACQSEPAQEPVVQDAPETAAALPTVANGSGRGTYLVTGADGTQMTAVINADGTYVDTAADGSLVAEGSWTVADGKTCFTPTTDGVQSMCDGESGRAAEQFVVGGIANPFMHPLYFSQRMPLPAVPAGFVQGRRIQQLRASIGGLSWEPYFLWIAGGDSLSPYRRIAGLERSFEISALGFARLPAVRVRGGAGWSFDEPFRDRLRAWLSVNYSP